MIRITKKNIIRIIITTLLMNALPIIYAETDSDDKFAENVKIIGGGASQMYGQYIQQQIQSAQMMNNANMLNRLGPGCMQNGRPCHITPAKYFPECPITNSMVNFPRGMCETRTMNPMQVEQMSSYKQLANNWVNQFDHMLNPAQNSQFPVGLKCLADKQASLNQQLQNTENSLTALQTQLKKDLQIFKENNKKILEELEKNNKELFGLERGSSNNEDKMRNMRNYFSPNCQNVIGKDNFNQQQGLVGILKGMSLANTDAGNYLINRNAIEADIRRALERVNNKIKNEGVISIETGTIDVELKNLNPATLAVLNKAREEYRLNKARIESQIKDIQPNYKLPIADNNFSVDISEFVQTAQHQFKKQYINECLTGEDKGVAIPLESVLNSLQQKSTANGGNARDKYKSALQLIIKSDDSLDQKLQQIKDLERIYSDITITYQNQQALRVTQTPYQLYMNIAKACEQRYSVSQTSTTSGAGTTITSQGKKVDRAVNLIKEYQTLNETFSARLNQSVNEQVLNCSGVTKKSEDGSCSKSLDRTNENFCIAHANQCAGEVQACYLEADKQVKAREVKMASLAKTFNDNITALIARSNQLYDSQKGQVQGLVGYIQQRFAGTQFELPKDMFVPTPESGKSEHFGVTLVGGHLITPKGEMRFLEDQSSLIGRIEKFKDMIKSQGKSTNELLKNYIDNQASAMDEQRRKWDELAIKCGTLYDESKSMVDKYNQEGMESQAKAQNSAGQFCKRFRTWKKNPNPGCIDSLFKALEALSKNNGETYVNDGAVEVVATMKDVCDQNQSEIQTAKKEKEQNKMTFQDICKTTTANDANFVSELKRAIGSFTFNEPTIDNSAQEKKIKDLQDELLKKTTDKEKKEIEDKITQIKAEIDSAKNKGFSNLLRDEAQYKLFLTENKFSTEKIKLFDSLRGHMTDSEASGSVCENLSKKNGYDGLAKLSINDDLKALQQTVVDNNIVQVQLRQIGEEASEITCEAGSDSSRDILKNLFSTPMAIQNLGGTIQK